MGVRAQFFCLGGVYFGRSGGWTGGGLLALMEQEGLELPMEGQQRHLTSVPLLLPLGMCVGNCPLLPTESVRAELLMGYSYFSPSTNTSCSGEAPASPLFVQVIVFIVREELGYISAL